MKIKKIQRKFVIKIPENIAVIYSKKKNLSLLLGLAIKKDLLS